MENLSKNQRIVFDAICCAVVANSGDYVAQGKIGSHMGKLPHPNSLDSLEKKGLIERNPSVSWAEYRPA